MKLCKWGDLKRLIIFFLIYIIFNLFLNVIPVSADIFLYDEIYRRPEFREAYSYLELQQNGKGRESLEKLINATKDPEIKAAALYFIGSRFGHGNSESFFQQIVRDYPGTRFWFAAKSALMAHECNGEPECISDKFDKFNIKMGYPSVNEVLKDNIDHFNPLDIPVEFRNSVVRNYDFIGSYGNLSIKDRLKVYLFIRTKFPKYNWNNVIDSIQTCVFRFNKIHSFEYMPKDTFPPEIRPIADHEHNSVGDRRPRIEFELTDGDITQSHVALDKLVFTLNGQDLTDHMKVSSHLNTSGEFDRRNPKKHTFERLRIWYKPAASLPPGRYVVYVKATDNVRNWSEKTWTFTVR